MKNVRRLCGLGLLLLLASNIWTISRWNESRGVYDDVCYLRQAHLFQKFGPDGINTDVRRDDDRYLAEKLKAIGYERWNEPQVAPCHTWIPATGKFVMQYPPGTGFALAMFPSGFQVIPLYALANATIVGFALLGLFRARDPAGLALAAVFGFVATYLMINPTKASYSVAPTMMVCALAGYLTAQLFNGRAGPRLLLTAMVGLLIGVSVNFRLPNLLLSAGYFLFLAGAFLLARSRETFLQGLVFGVALLVGIAPTLIANAINAGSPFATTYSSGDALPPEVNASVLWKYFVDIQFTLLAIACVWTAVLWRFDSVATRRVCLVVAGNLVVNLIFFMTHPIYTPYYTVPIAMLSLWTLLFATLDARAGRLKENAGVRQPARA